MIKVFRPLLILAVVIVVSALDTHVTSAVSSVTMSGRVTDQAGTPVGGTTIEIKNSSAAVIAWADTNEEGRYSLAVEAGTYDIFVTPPPQSGFGAIVFVSRTISGDTGLDVVLVTSTINRLTGHILDALGQGAPGTQIEVWPRAGGMAARTYTDQNGLYALDLQPGDYSVNAWGSNSDRTRALPETYSLSFPDGVTVEGTTVLDVPLPLERVTVHVDDAQGVAVAGVGLGASGYAGCSLMVGTRRACGSSSYNVNPWGSQATTDANGEVVMWLFPAQVVQNDPMMMGYTFTAMPPSGAPFVTFSVPRVEVTTDKRIEIVLNFDHQPPVTTIALSPAPDASGRYQDPVTVTLSATAASGYSLDRIEYKVDGGQTLLYQEPFAVDGDGQHRVDYWAVDNSGAAEPVKTTTFEILADRIPPTTSTDLVPAANAAGWHRDTVTVRLTAADNPGGSGVQSIDYQLSGAQLGGATIAGSQATIAVTAEGVTTITFFATDRAGNIETSQTLAVRIDRTAPLATCSATPNVLWPPNHQMVQVGTSVQIADMLSGAGAFELKSVSSNEPENGLGDGDTFPDISGFRVGVASTNGFLRAERAGGGEGRLYSLTYTAFDIAGNSAVCTTGVVVPHDQRK